MNPMHRDYLAECSVAGKKSVKINFAWEGEGIVHKISVNEPHAPRGKSLHTRVCEEIPDYFSSGLEQAGAAPSPPRNNTHASNVHAWMLLGPPESVDQCWPRHAFDSVHWA